MRAIQTTYWGGSEINTPDFYSELGAKVAIARNQHDEARAMFHTEHFRKAKALESDADKVAAYKLYNEAYTEARVVR